MTNPFIDDEQSWFSDSLSPIFQPNYNPGESYIPDPPTPTTSDPKKADVKQWEPKFTNEETSPHITRDEVNKEWHRNVLNYKEGIQLLCNVYIATENEKNGDSKAIQLSNLNSTVYLGMDKGRHLLQSEAAYYTQNKATVIELGNLVDKLAEMSTQTTKAYQEKKSNDFSYAEEIAAYWGFREEYNIVADEAEKVADKVKVGINHVADGIVNAVKGNSTYILVMVGLVVAGLYFWKK